MAQADWAKLLKRMRFGDAEAMSILYDETSRAVFGLTLKILGNRADAEEVVLDVYEKAWRTAASYDPARGSVLSWLIIMARSMALDRLRASRPAEPITEAESFVSPDPNPEMAAAAQQKRAKVSAALEQLPAEQKQLLELAFFKGLSQSELAENLQIPLGTVKTRVRLGLSKLRSLMEGQSA